MGSLFDGIGGFPLAAVHCGVKPVWASEIESFPIQVTKLRFPDMLHVGDITRLNGAELPPVDIICGGSPCQDLSVAGARAGLSGKRSGLFMEQVRIVKEMRNADILRGRSGIFVRPRFCAGKTSQEHSPAGSRKAKISGSSSKKSSELSSIVYQFLDLTPGNGNLLGLSYWEILSPWLGDALMLNTGVSPKDAKESSLWQILEEQPHHKYYLTRKACRGILRRASERGKDLPEQLHEALEIQSGVRRVESTLQKADPSRRNQGVDGYNGDLTGDVSSTLGTNCGMSTGRNGILQAVPIGVDAKHACSTGQMTNTLGTYCGSPTNRNNVMVPIAFAQNQRDEVRDLNNVAGALNAQPGMKQQTYVAAGVVSKGNGDCFLTEDKHTSLSSGGGQAGQGYPCLLCLNDQGGQIMSCSENISGTLRAQEHGHQPLLLSPDSQPAMYENHGIDSRYTGPLEVAPTMSARYGTGGNNVPLIEQPDTVFCIVGNTIDREPENGGNGLGCQEDIAYTLTSCDRHAIYSRQRVDVFQENDVVSTESARQHKDATDLVMQPYQDTVGTLVHSDHKGINNQYVGEDKCIIEGANLIRRLTPLECERLQGFPDHWTEIPDASDSARYKALGNSVAIPCVDFVVNGMAVVLRNQYAAIS